MEIRISQKELNKSYQEYLNFPEKYCEICSSEMKEKSVSLNCGHRFHYDCLFYSIFKDHKINSNNLKNHTLQCPYCRSNFDFLPLIDGKIPLKNIHKEYDEYIIKDNLKYPIDKMVKIISGKYKNNYAKIKSVDENNVELFFDQDQKTRKLKKTSIQLSE